MGSPREKKQVKAAPVQASYAAAFAVVVLMLIAFGLVMAYSASFADSIDSGVSPFRGMRMQFISVAIGVVTAVVLWRFLPMKWLSGMAAYIIWGLCFILVAITPFVGREAYGATRWLYIGSLGFQPSELMKIALVIAVAKALADWHAGAETKKRTVLLCLLFVGLPLLFLVAPEPIGQSDLGSTMICCVGILAVLLLGGVSGKILAPVCVVGVAGAVFAVRFIGYRSARIAAWLHPWDDPLDGGYQLIHSYYALAEGGLFGVGLGQGHEKFQYLPFAPNDFIFAVVGEELGLVGAALVVLLFLALLVLGLRIAFSCRDEFGKMVAGSVVVMVVFQAFLNIGCVTGLLPTTGKPLPFFSMGGTALLVVIASMGLVLAAARDYNGTDLYVKRRDNMRLVRNGRTGQTPRG